MPPDTRMPDTPLAARPRVAISRCLLGDPVRYDGGHKREPSLTDALGAQVEWVPVCPELETGMGVPREPIHLVAGAGGDLRLVGVASGDDWTERMRAWTRVRLRELSAVGVCGVVLKSKSPSCGLRGIPVTGAEDGSGMFAALLVEVFPGLPVEEEDRLRDAGAREEFLARVQAYQSR